MNLLIDTRTQSGRLLSDAGAGGHKDEDFDPICTDQQMTLVTLEYLERRDRLDRKRYGR